MQQRAAEADLEDRHTKTKGAIPQNDAKKENNKKIKIQPNNTTAHDHKTDSTQNNSELTLNLNSNLNKRTDNMETEVRPRKKQNITQSYGIQIEKSNLEISEKQFKKRKQSNKEKQDEEEHRKKWKSDNITK